METSKSTYASPRNLAGITLDAKTPDRLYVSIGVVTDSISDEVLAFVDCGSDFSLIDVSTVQLLNLNTFLCDNPLTFEVIDMNILPSGPIDSFVICNLRLNDIDFEHKLYVIKTCHSSMVLGLDWLKKFNPTINWKTLSLEFVNTPESKLKLNNPGTALNSLVLNSEDLENIPSPPETSLETLEQPFETLRAAKFSELSELNLEHPATNLDPLKLCSAIAAETLFRTNVDIESHEGPPEESEGNPVEDIHQQIDYSTGEIDKIKLSLPMELRSYADVFSKASAEILPQHRKYDISIDIQDGKKVPWGPIYSLSEPELKVLREYLDENLAKGFIRPSTSPAGAALFFVKKKSGELRPVVDYRGLNAISIKNRYPLPLIHEMLTRFSKAKVFSKIDLRGAYNLVRIRKGDEWKTAFRCRYGHFEYCVMPFGLTNAPAVFQYLMNDVLYDYLDVFCVVYLDDILIYSSTPEEHIAHVCKVLQRLRDNALYAKLEKCIFLVKSVEFLGYVISDTGIEMDPKRVSSISSWPVPASIKEVQSFLGFVNFYRTFIPNYSKTILPILKLLKKDSRFDWNKLCSESFQNLKNSFKSSSILVHADTSKRFIVETDASDFALGGVLSQYHGDTLRPVAFYSRKLSPAKINYEIYDKELLAIVVCFYQWRALLLSNPDPVSVYTDHKNLLYFSSARKLNRRQARWSLFLCDFNFELLYRPGKEGGKPDALSRRADYQLKPGDVQVEGQNQVLLPQEKFLIGSTRKHESELSFLDKIKIDQSEDEFLRKLAEGKDFTLEDDCLMFRGRIVIPNSKKIEVLKLCHDSKLAGHHGVRKTFQLISKTYWWPSYRKDCKSYVESCHICSRAKANRRKPAGLLQSLPCPPRPWYSISMDMITHLPEVNGKNSILVVVDRFTKMSHFVPCSETMTSAQLADIFFENIVRLHGLPSDIVSDRGSIFVSQFWSSLAKNLNISRNLSTAYHPQSDGQTERINQCLEQYLRIYSDYLQVNWVRNLPYAELSYNMAYHDSIKMSPFYANYGFDPPLDLSSQLISESPTTVKDYLHTVQENIGIIKEELKLASESAEHQANKKRRYEDFGIGDRVFLNRKNIRTTRPCIKLDWKNLGPFEIVDKISPTAYKLKLPSSMSRLHDVFHISLLSKVKGSDLPGRQYAEPPPLLIEDSGTYYEVEDILDAKYIRGKLKYLLSWKGYGPSSNSWEPVENLINCEEAVRDFNQRYPEKVKPPAKGRNC